MRAKLKMPNTRRLLRLASLLEKLPRKRFNYGNWVGSDWKGANNLSCGTTACALGWATTVRGWNLTLRRNRYYGTYVGIGTRRLNGTDPMIASFVAGATAFGLTYEESAYLFAPGSESPYEGLPQSPGGGFREATPKQVARHIRQFVVFTQKHPKVLREEREMGA